MSTPNSPSKTPTRRVLGDLTRKAINTPTRHAYALDPSRPTSPLKQIQTLSPHLLKGVENMPPVSAFKTGRKRSIHEVDCIGELETVERMYGTGDEGLLRRGTPVTAAALREHTVSYSMVRRVHHVINHEQILRTDNTPGSPTEPNTPSNHDQDEETLLQLPDNAQDHGNSQESQASQISISQFFDFDSGIVEPAKETTAELKRELGSETVRKPAVESQMELLVEPPRKKSRMELLRMNLGLGMYKVKTNQVSKRGKDIISTWETTTSSKSSMDTSSSLALTTSTDSTTSQAISAVKSVSKDAFRSYSANLDPGRPVGRLQLAGDGLAPVLPQAKVGISSHMLYDPSSPPTSISPEQLMSPVRAVSNYKTPVPQVIRTIDGDYVDEGEATEVERLHGFEEGELTSAAVKGDAARGLLGLMTAKR
jgi:hypothetical protein